MHTRKDTVSWIIIARSALRGLSRGDVLSSKILVLCKSFTLHTSVCRMVSDAHPTCRLNSPGISSTLLLCPTQAKSNGLVCLILRAATTPGVENPSIIVLLYYSEVLCWVFFILYILLGCYWDWILCTLNSISKKKKVCLLLIYIQFLFRPSK